MTSLLPLVLASAETLGWPKDNERARLHDQLPPTPVEALTPDQRARVAGVVLLVLRRRAGWAA